MPGSGGTITTQNLTPNSGPGTPGSSTSLAIDPNGVLVGIEVSGTYTGALTPQGSDDGTNWVTIGGTPLTQAGVQSATIPSGQTGLWTIHAAGFSQFRLTALAAVTGSAVVSMGEQVG